jgi:hypothetical protein
MADRRDDDLESWAGGRVEPLPPPPGTFELIRRRARRRKLRRLAVSAAAAAAVAAAAVTVPQVVSLRPSPPTAQSQAGRAGPAPSATPATSRAGSAPGGATGTAPAPGGPVPPGFRPTSVTFIGTRTGWVIGQAGTPGHCATRYCTSMARTDDAGRTWAGVPAPLAGPPAGPAGVSQVRFLNALDGWAFGPQLFATHDGGRDWTAVDTHGLRVTGLEAAGDRAFGVFASCRGGWTAYAPGCSVTLYSSPASGDQWAPVGAATTGLAGGTRAPLVLTGSRGYLLAPDGTLYAGPAGGGAPWQQAGRIPCAAGQAQAGGQPAGALLAAATAADLVLVCAPPGGGAAPVYTSDDGGIDWHSGAAAPGAAAAAAASPAGAVVLATSQGIDVLPAGSGSWQAAALDGQAPGGGFGYVGMTTGEQGVALPADPAAGTVWFTFDGGLSWHPSAVAGPRG